MARPLRIEYEGAFYLITARGNESKEIYRSQSDYDKFKGYLKEAQDKYSFILHGYILMSNHYLSSALRDIQSKSNKDSALTAFSKIMKESG